ncbi:G-protein coupled receptor Mth2-like [Dendronephthya gigantea]|uniref:G-protein coupled receptor Mth2-like n=1 Tax=Dendronephthya gigantea TaxID=151771 RepID=UPI00106B484A|nr:G-protein coupled receptor Mth2-like [Dendronephthya gigantea]
MIISSFAWMTVMSYDVSKTFSEKGKASDGNSSSGFRRYVVFATSISSGIVTLTFILGETEAIPVGYGESSSCWIGQRLSLILFFYVPVAIMLVFNAVSLVWTIFSIRNVTKITKDVQKSVKSDTRGKNVKIYVKLSTVMGVTWLLGFGAAHNTIVAYLYVIVNSLQGVFIFVAFVLNKRTMNMWRNNSGHCHSTRRQTKLSKESYASTNQLTGAISDQHQHRKLVSLNPNNLHSNFK